MFSRNVTLRGWMFVLIYLLLNRIMLAIYPKHFSERFYKRPKFPLKKQLYSSVSYSILLNATMLYIAFLPVKTGSSRFYAGTVIYLVSLILYMIALTNYASTPPDRPAVKGIYKISRHPQQVLTEFLLMGFGWAASSWITIISCTSQLILLYQSMNAQENYCIEKYGKEYEDYMKKTPKYFLLF